MELSEVIATCKLQDDCPGCSTASNCPVGLGQCATNCETCSHSRSCPVHAISKEK